MSPNYFKMIISGLLSIIYWTSGQTVSNKNTSVRRYRDSQTKVLCLCTVSGSGSWFYTVSGSGFWVYTVSGSGFWFYTVSVSGSEFLCLVLGFYTVSGSNPSHTHFHQKLVLITSISHICTG